VANIPRKIPAVLSTAIKDVLFIEATLVHF
jgi:hypothetical protein